MVKEAYPYPFHTCKHYFLIFKCFEPPKGCGRVPHNFLGKVRGGLLMPKLMGGLMNSMIHVNVKNTKSIQLTCKSQFSTQRYEQHESSFTIKQELALYF